MPQLTPTQIDAVWEASEPERNWRAKQADYYTGKHAITKSSETYVDGSKKSQRVTNWPRYAVHRYLGALTGSPFVLTPKNEDEPSPGLEWYADLTEAQNLNAVDAELLRCALIHGVGVELHEFHMGRVSVRSSDPLNWAFVFDEVTEDLKAAIHRVKLPGNTYHAGEFLEEETEFQTYYDESQIVDFKRGKDAKDWEPVGQPIRHGYKRVPVNVWRLNKKREGIITRDIIGQCDEYNEIDSASGDDIRNDVDAMLILTGISGDWLNGPADPNAPDGETNASVVRRTKMLPFPDKEADAKFLQRMTDVERVSRRLARTREHVHLMADVPDVNTIVGATGGTSGIALRLKFMPMIHRANTMILYLKESLRRRVDLLNAIARRFEGVDETKSQIEDYDPHIEFSLPVNRLEEWRSISALAGIVSQRTMLSLLSDIEDPDAELERLSKETPALGGAGGPVEGEAGAAVGEVLTARAEERLGPAVTGAALEIDRLATDGAAQPGVLARIGSSLGGNGISADATV